MPAPPKGVRQLGRPSELLSVRSMALGADFRTVAVIVIRGLRRLHPEPEALYIGKLSVAATHRGTGLARSLITMAHARATELGLGQLEFRNSARDGRRGAAGLRSRPR